MDLWSASLVIGSNDRVCGRAWARGEESAFRSGDILLTNAGELQKTTLTDEQCSLFTIFWEQSALERAASEAGVPGPVQWSLGLLSSAPIAAKLSDLRELLESGADADSVRLAYDSITAALIFAAGQDRDTRWTPYHPAARRAALHASADLHESLSLEQMAAQVHMSKCHFARCFQKSFGVPPHRYRMLLRLQRARRLLETGLSVAAVAKQTGFADAPHLTRFFREWLGVSPAVWGSAWRASTPSSAHQPRTQPPPWLRKAR